MKNILVTGSEGFIGKHLVNKLKEHFNVFECDIKNNDIPFGSLSINYLIDCNIDTVFHLAALTNVQESIEYPDKYFMTNVSDTLKFMKVCANYRGIKKFVFTSSAACYGSNSNAVESSSNCYPLSPYAADKLAIENYLRAFFESYGLHYMALRLFNVYGPYSSTKGIIPKIVDCIENDKVLYLNNLGESIRDFIHVDDVVQSLINAGQSTRWSNFVVNVGTGQGTSIIDLEKLIEGILQKQVIISFNKNKVNEVSSSIADTTLAKTIDVHCYETKLEDGLRAYLSQR